MIQLDYPGLIAALDAHCSAIEQYVASKGKDYEDGLYNDVRSLLTRLPATRPSDYKWLRDFISASPDLLDTWVINCPKKLQFTQFKKIYKSRFAKDPDTYLDSAKTYNAYTLLELIDVNVCPYCDDEYIDTFETPEGKRRTVDVDHFHPKGEEDFPALAMCFYNLIPSCKGCNQVMNHLSIGANPYSPDIETLSSFVSVVDIDHLGMQLDALSDNSLQIRLKTIGGMKLNQTVLGLEERYNHRKLFLRNLFRKRRALQEDNVAEKERMDIPLKTYIAYLERENGGAYPALRGKEIHQKIRKDILGF